MNTNSVNGKAAPESKRIQLVLRDAVGAAVSAVSMLIFGILMPNLLGLPTFIASVLVAVAFGFCVHSYWVYRKLSNGSATEAEGRRMLRRIAWLNLGYLLATLSIAIVHWDGLTVIGRLFLLSEGLVLLALSLYEFWIAKA